jgi:hypothetical protein
MSEINRDRHPDFPPFNVLVRVLGTSYIIMVFFIPIYSRETSNGLLCFCLRFVEQRPDADLGPGFEGV